MAVLPVRGHGGRARRSAISTRTALGGWALGAQRRPRARCRSLLTRSGGRSRLPTHSGVLALVRPPTRCSAEAAGVRTAFAPNSSRTPARWDPRANEGSASGLSCPGGLRLWSSPVAEPTKPLPARHRRPDDAAHQPPARSCPGWVAACPSTKAVVDRDGASSSRRMRRLAELVGNAPRRWRKLAQLGTGNPANSVSRWRSTLRVDVIPCHVRGRRPHRYG